MVITLCALRCLWRSNHIFPAKTLIRFCDRNRSFFQVNIFWNQSQQFSQTHPRPVQNHKCRIGKPFVHNTVDKLLKFLFRPEIHFFGFALSHASSFCTGITFQIVISDRIIKYCTQLIINCFQISRLIPLFNQLILPLSDVE